MIALHGRRGRSHRRGPAGPSRLRFCSGRRSRLGSLPGAPSWGHRRSGPSLCPAPGPRRGSGPAQRPPSPPSLGPPWALFPGPRRAAAGRPRGGSRRREPGPLLNWSQRPRSGEPCARGTSAHGLQRERGRRPARSSRSHPRTAVGPGPGEADGETVPSSSCASVHGIRSVHGPRSPPHFAPSLFLGTRPPAGPGRGPRSNRWDVALPLHQGPPVCWTWSRSHPLLSLGGPTCSSPVTWVPQDGVPSIEPGPCRPWSLLRPARCLWCLLPSEIVLFID